MLKSIGNPGRLDCKLTLLQPTLSRDGIGAELEGFTTAGTIRAERMWKNSEERYEASQQVGAITQSFKARDYLTLYNITQRWRFVFENETYHISGIERGGRKNFVIITGTKRDNV